MNEIPRGVDSGDPNERARRERIAEVRQKYEGVLRNVVLAMEGGATGLDNVVADIKAKMELADALARCDLTGQLIEELKIHIEAMVLDRVGRVDPTNEGFVTLLDLMTPRDGWLQDVTPEQFNEIRGAAFALLIGSSLRVEPSRIERVHKGRAAAYTYATIIEGLYLRETLDAHWPEGSETPELLDSRTYYGLSIRD